MSVICAICLECYHSNEEREVFALKCGHNFHGECLEEWIISSRHKKCPHCRTNFINEAPKRVIFTYESPEETVQDKIELCRINDLGAQEWAILKCENERLIVQQQRCIKSIDRLQSENNLKEQQLVALRKELFQCKVQQVKSSKTFVDLTNDSNFGDSDIEIVEDCGSSSKKMKISKEKRIVELNDENRKDQTGGHAQ